MAVSSAEDVLGAYSHATVSSAPRAVLEMRVLLFPALIRSRGDPAQHQFFEGARVGGAKERAGVVEAAHVVQQHHDGQARVVHSRNAIDAVAGLKWYAVHVFNGPQRHRDTRVSVACGSLLSRVAPFYSSTM